MSAQQFDMLLVMLCGMRVALLGMVDAIEVLLIANGKLRQRTSDLRRELRFRSVCEEDESIRMQSRA